MSETSREHWKDFLRRFERGLDAATRNNILAYGYSVTITAAFGILTVPQGTPGIMDVFAFAAGAVIAFALVGSLSSGGFREELEDEPSRIKVLGSAFALLSVGLALGAALIVGRLLPGMAAWLVGAFSTTVAYLILVGLELAVADHILRRNG